MKAKIRKTGEIVDIIAYSQYVNRSHNTDYVSYIDSKGIEHDIERGLNFYWDFEVIEEHPVNWEQRRFELTKIVVPALISSNYQSTMAFDSDSFNDTVVQIVDGIIRLLKEDGE